MPDSDLQITFGADASGVAKGCADVKTAVAGVAPNIEALGKSFGDLTEKIKSGFEGLSSVLSGLKDAGAASAQSIAALSKAGDGAEGVQALGAAVGDLKTAGKAGAEGLAGMADAAGEAVGVVGDIVGVAMSAAGAVTEWAQHTLESSTASETARGSAAALMGAINSAGGAFGQVGDELGAAFAPVLTDVVKGLTDLAKAFSDSDAQGGIAKIAIDAVAITLKAIIGVVELIVDAFGLLWDQIKSGWDGAGALFARVAQTIGRDLNSLVQDFETFGKVALDAMSGNFAALGIDAQGALTQIKSSFKLLSSDAASDVKAFADGSAPGWHKYLEDRQADAEGLLRLVHDTDGKLAAQVLPASDPKRRAAHHHAAPAGPATKAHSDTPAPCPTPDCAAIAQNDTNQTTQIVQQASDAQGQINHEAASRDDATAKAAYADTADAAQHAFEQQDAAAAASADNQIGQIQAVGEAANRADRQRVKSAETSAQAVERAWSSVVSPIVSTFSKGLLEMAEGTKSFAQVAQAIGQQLLSDMLRVVDQAVEKWLWGETEKVLASSRGQAILQALGLKDLALQIANDVKKAASAGKTAAAQTLAHVTQSVAGVATDNIAAQAEKKTNAQVAYSGAIAAISAIPIIGPSMAPGVAAFMAAQAGAAGGYDIPFGVNPLTQLHQQEMVLPAHLANPMRAMMADYKTSGGGAPGHTVNFGDFHVHGGPAGMSSGEFRQALADHAEHVAGAVAGALRGGWRPSYRQPIGAL